MGTCDRAWPRGGMGKEWGWEPEMVPMVGVRSSSLGVAQAELPKHEWLCPSLANNRFLSLLSPCTQLLPLACLHLNSQ